MHPRARLALASLLGAALVAAPATASAFCGFYVNTGGGTLTNRATQVVLMRDGERTVLTMQNSYDGPPEDFALVVPVPVVLHRRDVRTLPRAAIERVERISAPRLVEYWERDPCEHAVRAARGDLVDVYISNPSLAESKYTLVTGVRIEAKFAVGEYDVQILSARDSTDLETWLKGHGYALPDGAAAALRPYVQAGMKFFVARVALDRVTRDAHGRLTLSPLRVHYDSDRFSLPIRLGLLNADGAQDLIVHILARDRYQAANRPNVAIPTNLDVTPETRGAFAEFYAALLDRTLAAAPGAAVTEYAWRLASCDPCPGPTLDAATVAQLGGDVLWPAPPAEKRGEPLGSPIPPGGLDIPNDDPFQTTEARVLLDHAKTAPKRPAMNSRWPANDLVITRLHLRYGRDDPGEDLVFQVAPPIAGGREGLGPRFSTLSNEPRRSPHNLFQARYAIRHPWPGLIACADPLRGNWAGSPPDGARTAPQVVTDGAFARRDVSLSTFLVDDVDAPGGALPPVPPYHDPPPRVTPSGCGRCDATDPPDAAAPAIVGLALLRRRRRSARHVHG